MTKFDIMNRVVWTLIIIQAIALAAGLANKALGPEPSKPACVCPEE